MDDELDMRHFQTLRQRINNRLTKLGLCAEQTRYRWLYGALGTVPSNVVFICENPSQSGVKKAERAARCSGRQPDIEDQWRGGSPIKTFRPVLCEIGLKLTPPGERGGWQCYITNVIKEMAQTKTFRELGRPGKYAKAVDPGFAAAGTVGRYLGMGTPASAAYLGVLFGRQLTLFG